MLTINRIYQDDCTVGVMNLDEFRCYTLELPWRDNKKSVSCIPGGTYECEKHYSPTHGLCISVKHVVGRTHILIHVGNFIKETQGCVLVGDSIRDINNDGVPEVTSSVKTLEKLLDKLPDQFQLVIS